MPQMGSLQPEPTVPTGQTSAFPFPTANVADWLDGLAVTLASGGIAPRHAEGIQRRPKGVLFDAILLAVERARPDLGDLVEIGLYEQWISANNITSPLLYVAWFNIGVSFARIGNRTNAAIAYGNTLALRPDMHPAAINLGLLLEATGQPEQALATWRRATQPDEVRVALEIQQGRLLEKLGHLEEAERILHR